MVALEMRPRPTRIAVLLLVAGVVALAAGCGGGGKKSTPSSQGPQTQTAATTKTVTSPPASTGSSSTPTFASAKNCQDLAGLASKMASAIASSSGNALTTLQTEGQQLQALAKAAPAEIRGDFQTFATAFAGFVEALQKAGYTPGTTTAPTPAQVAALEAAAKKLDTPKLAQAEKHLEGWVKQNCKGVHLPTG